LRKTLKTVARRIKKETVKRRRATERLKGYEQEPARFVAKILGEHLWSKQREIVEAVAQHRRVAVQSCHDVGKSYVAARIVAWWLSAWPVGEAFVVTTAPTFPQVRAILWREISRAHKRGQLPGYTNQVEWWINGEIVGFGRKPDDLDMAAFQGIHARRVLVVADEACGLARAIWNGADSLITNDESHILAIGNPDDPASYFAEICKPGSGWHVIKISAFDSPNFTGEAIPDTLSALLVGRTWVEEKRKSWGETSPLYQSKVLAEFPEVGDDTLIPPSWILAARDRELPRGLPVELGVDIARYGLDATVIVARWGHVARVVKTLRKRDLMAVVGAIVEAIDEIKPIRVKIDDAGLGGGVTDRLKELASEGRITCAIVPVNVGVSANPPPFGQPDQFFLLRDELQWALRERFQEGAIDLDNDDELMSQAGSVKYWLDSRGRIRIESKDDMRKRLLPSPDHFDALMLAFGDAPLMDGQGAWDQARVQAEALAAAQAARAAAAIAIVKPVYAIGSMEWAAEQQAKT
jgi:hypothetical protein